MKRTWILCLLCFSSIWLFAFSPIQKENSYSVQIDLTNIVNDRVLVTVVPPILEDGDSAIYTMPKIIPGTYKVYNYGRFVHDLVAFNSLGDSLAVTTKNQNQWQIKDAKSLYKIQYWVSASYNTSSGIFAPAGTAISEDAFLLNNFGFIGYLEGFNKVTINLEVKKKNSFYGVTSLQSLSRTDSADSFVAADYFQLHDCPILYAEPDTASVNLNGLPITIGVFSPFNHIKAQNVRDALVPVFKAASAYLGGELPAEKYTVIVYGQSMQEALKGSGALEHHTSTVVNMPDIDEGLLEMFSDDDPMQMYRDIVAHEFFHIVTPLNIHSEQIADYDFTHPQMSEHLWLYEGVTEYNSIIAQARYGAFSLEKFLEMIRVKLDFASDYSADIPFTQMSKYSLDFFEDQYHNVYEQGAVIGLAIDLKLVELSNGKYRLVNLLEDLWNVYGADTFFVDQDLFKIMAEMSFPEMEEFLVRHIAGTEPLPLKELFYQVGIDYTEYEAVDEISTGGIQCVYHPHANAYVVLDVDTESEFASTLGIKSLDILKSWNGVEVEKGALEEVLANYKSTAKEGAKMSVLVDRKVNGVFKEVKLKSRVAREKQENFDVFSINKNLTDKQRSLRDLWFNN